MKKSLISMAFLVALLAGLQAVFGGGSDPAPLAPSRIVTDTGGELREVSIHLVPEASFAHDAWRDFLCGLDSSVEIQVVCENEDSWERGKALLSAWEVGNLSRFHPRFLRAALTPWNRDRMIVTDRTLFAPPAPHRGGKERKNEWKVPWILSGFGRSVEIAPFHFEGGDLIASERYVFATEVLVSRNPTLSRGELKRHVEELCGRTLILIGGEVPEHHIGMFLTPLDDRRVVVGRSEGPLAERLDHVAETLKKKGFEVFRSPLVSTEEEYAWITYNNNVMSGKTIYLPVYGIELDRKATELYESFGFRVVPVDVQGIYRLGGTLRCLMHVLARGEGE